MSTEYNRIKTILKKNDINVFMHFIENDIQKLCYIREDIGYNNDDKNGFNICMMIKRFCFMEFYIKKYKENEDKLLYTLKDFINLKSFYCENDFGSDDVEISAIDYHVKKYHNIKIIKLLLDNGADPNSYTIGNEKFLIHSANYKTCKLLLNYGVNIHALSIHDDNVITFICMDDSRFNYELKKSRCLKEKKVKIYNKLLKDNIKKIKLFISLGININNINSLNEHALYANPRYCIYKLLLENGLKLNFESAEHILRTIVCSDDEIVEKILLLLKHGMDINGKCLNGDTPLHFIEDVNVIKILLENGADPNIKNDKEGILPIEMDKSDEVKELLIKYGSPIK